MESKNKGNVLIINIKLHVVYTVQLSYKKYTIICLPFYINKILL